MREMLTLPCILCLTAHRPTVAAQDQIDHQSVTSGCPVNPVISSLLKLTLERIVQVHHFVSMVSGYPSHHIVCFHHVKPGAGLHELHLLGKYATISVHCYGRRSKPDQSGVI